MAARPANWLRDPQGVHWWLVAVRASFTIADGGRLELAEPQISPVLEPIHEGEPGRSSLRQDADLLGRKLGTDVLIRGSAHAPDGRPATTVPVRLQLGAIDKTLLVHGERVYQRGLSGLATSAPQPFVCAPIRYELAFGGSDTDVIDERNPVGRGVAADRARLLGRPAHRIEFPQGDPARSGRRALGRSIAAGCLGGAWPAPTTRPGRGGCGRCCPATTIRPSPRRRPWISARRRRSSAASA